MLRLCLSASARSKCARIVAHLLHVCMRADCVFVFGKLSGLPHLLLNKYSPLQLSKANSAVSLGAFTAVHCHALTLGILWRQPFG